MTSTEVVTHDIPLYQEEWMTPAEVAAMFNVDPKTVTRWSQAGRFTKTGVHVVKTLGGHRRYCRAGVHKILEMSLTSDWDDEETAE